MTAKILRALILGPPGSGKGTISSRIVTNFGLLHLSSGDLLRAQISRRTKDGQNAKQYIEDGTLVPDDLVIRLLVNELKTLKTSYLLDGFPRTVVQAEALARSENIDVVLNLDVPFATISDRLEKRWIHQSSGRVYHLEWNPPKKEGIDDITGEPLTQRDDDKPKTVQARLKTYETQTFPLLEFYRKQGILHSFHGTESNIIYPKLQDFLKTFLSEKME